MPGALNMIEALRSAVKGLASGIGDYYRREAGMDTTPVSSLSPEELSLLRDNSELFYRLYPTAPSVDFDKLNSSVTTNTPQASTAIPSETSSEQGARDTMVKPPVQPPQNVWEETFSKAREERQQPVVPNEIELGVTQNIINSYFRKGGDYNTAALLYKRDTGMDFNSLVNKRNNLQRALGVSIGVAKLNPRPVSQSSQPVVKSPSLQPAQAPSVQAKPSPAYSFTLGDKIITINPNADSQVKYFFDKYTNSQSNTSRADFSSAKNMLRQYATAFAKNNPDKVLAVSNIIW